MQPGQVRVGKRKTFFQQTPENPGFFIGFFSRPLKIQAFS
jgi:hypothetical protein